MKPIILILMDHLRLTEPTLPNKALMSDLSQGKDDASFRVSVLLSSGSALLFHLASRGRGRYEPSSLMLITYKIDQKNRDLEN